MRGHNRTWCALDANRRARDIASRVAGVRPSAATAQQVREAWQAERGAKLSQRAQMLAGGFAHQHDRDQAQCDDSRHADTVAHQVAEPFPNQTRVPPVVDVVDVVDVIDVII